MSSIMKNGASVDPEALKDMKQKTSEYAEQLKRTSEELINRVENLNQSGFQDKKFAELFKAVEDKKVDLEKLNKILISFSEYLGKLEKIITGYQETETLTSKTFQID
jgi:uncharacterized protein YukE